MRKRKMIRTILFCALTVIFCFSAFMIVHTLSQAKQEQETFDELVAIVSDYVPDETSTTEQEEETEAGETEPTPLAQYEPLYELNSDYYGWLSIEGTQINYPVMFTPWDSEYYLRRDFYGDYSQSGTPFIDGDCPADGSYLLVYGHHMKNNTMFGTLPDYGDRSFWEAHRSISFNTRYEQREYEVIAAFYSRLYRENETGVFRYYVYKDLSDPQVFDEYMAGVKAAAIYDTGVTAEYGDQILVLSTCNYHTSDGRFVVVAKRAVNH